MIWFTADTHFGHANIIKLTCRPWETVEAMDRALLANINACVAPTDELYILGDFSYRLTVDEARAVRKKIACRHVHLLQGNHDKDWSQPEVAGTFMVEQPVTTLKAQGHKLALCHYPMLDWPGMFHGSIHLHGHIHTQGSDYNELNRARGIWRYDVGVDANGYVPVSLDAILGWFDGAPCTPTDWRNWAVGGIMGEPDDASAAGGNTGA